MKNHSIHLIPGSGTYGVDMDGGVWSRSAGEWKELSLSVNGKWGYLKVKIDEGKTKKVHDLVAVTFLGPKPSGYDVNHIDGNKKNNRIENLEYCSRSDNMKHAYRLGLRPRMLGESSLSHKLTEADVIDIRISYSNGEWSTRSLALIYSVTQTTVRNIIDRKSWAHVA